jgi:hypothetical protein
LEIFPFLNIFNSEDVVEREISEYLSKQTPEEILEEKDSFKL